MSAAVTATLNSIQDKVRSFLKEKNAFTNILETIEVKTKVNREYIFYGRIERKKNYLLSLINFVNFYNRNNWIFDTLSNGE